MRAAVVIGLGLGLGHTALADPSWKLEVPERLALTAGTTGALPLELAVGPGFTVSKDAPVVIDIAPDPALVVKRRRLGRSDAVDPDAAAPRFQIAVRGDAPGDFGLALHARFWVCGAKVCTPIDARRTVAVAVAPAAAPSTPAP